MSIEFRETGKGIKNKAACDFNPALFSVLRLAAI